MSVSALGPAKRWVRGALRAVDPDWETLIVDWYALLRSGRSSSDLRWQPIQRCPDRRLDAAGATIGHRLFVVGGFASHHEVLDVVDVLDMQARRWVERWRTPPGMAQSHLATATDGLRYIFLMAGQLGNHCSPPTRNGFALDTQTGLWRELPPLPAARYAATAALWRGRLHVLGGSREDRCTPADNHWSIAVADGRAVEADWRPEPAIPRAGPHRASAVVADRLHVFGGQTGDWIPIPGDPDCRCQPPVVTETHYSDVYRLGPDGTGWTPAAPMAVAVSHTEGSIVVVDGVAYLFGGQCAAEPGRAGTAVSDVIQRYDVSTDRWTVVGTLPYRAKTAVIGHHAGWVYMVGGQRDRGRDDPGPGEFVNQCWRARLT